MDAEASSAPPEPGAGSIGSRSAGAGKEPRPDAAGRPDELEPESRPLLALDRLVFFSDAVFAIAITLLAVDLRLEDVVPGADPAAFGRALEAALPRIAAFGLSFWVIAVVWYDHYRAFNLAASVHPRTVAHNLVLLLIVAFVPFPTTALGAHVDNPAAVVLYALTAIVLTLVGATLWRSVIARDRRGVHAGFLRQLRFRAIVTVAVFTVTLPVAVVSSVAAVVLWLVAIPAQAGAWQLVVRSRA